MTAAATQEPEFKKDYSLIKPFFRGFRPVRRISVSQWAETYRVLPKISNSSGAWHNDTTPYLVPIMDALSVFSTFKKVVFMKGAQIGGTSAGENFIGYNIHIAPCAMIVMFPTIAVAKRNSKRRLATLISDSPALRNLVSKAKSRDGNNTILEKDFAGGTILLVGANSPSDLRSVEARCLMLDEVDEYPRDLDGQGDAIELAIVRTNSFDTNKKIFMLSTPKTKGTSNIEKAMEETDWHECYVPCPHCAPDAPVTIQTPEHYFAKTPPPGYQTLVLEGFKFTPGRPQDVYYECKHCKGEIHNHHKAWFLPRYVMVPLHPERSNPDLIGFHVNGFYSPVGMYSWQTMAAKYQAALKDPEKMKTFVQTTQGLPFEEDGTQPPANLLFERNLDSPYRSGEMPDGPCFLTCGIDVQKDRIEYEVVGWGKGRRSWSVEYGVLIGKPEEPNVWLQVEQLLNKNWVRKSDGLMFGLSLTLIDEGYSKNEVYAFCLRAGLHRIIPVNGMPTQKNPISSPQPVFITREGVKMQALVHINISTDYYKSALYSHLILPRQDKLGPEFYCHFPSDYDIEHYKRLTAEKKITSTSVTGYDKGVWSKPPGKRNEQLDVRVYAMAAASLMQIELMDDSDFDGMVGSLSTGPDEEETQTQRPQNNGRLPDLGGLPSL